MRTHSLQSPRRWSTAALAGIGLFATALGFGAARFLRGRHAPMAPLGTALEARREPTRSGPDHAVPANAKSQWEKDWRKLLASSSSISRDRELAAMIEALAGKDPKQALELASVQNNWELRDRLRDAALRGWGSVDPDAAAAWASDRRLEDRMPSVDAVLTGAAHHPEEAIRVAMKLCAADPVPAGDYGHTLVSALIEQGAFEAAARFAAGATMVDRQPLLLESSFRQWAQYQPQRALDAVASLTEPSIRSAAFEGLISGWADADSHQLAEYAQSLPPGENRSRALSAALPHWVEKDPASAMEWIGRFDSSVDLDEGISAVAKLPSLSAQHPETAMEWADNISDRSKRIMTKYEVFSSWAQNNFGAAKKFAENTKDPDERQMMFESLSRSKPRG